HASDDMIAQRRDRHIRHFGVVAVLPFQALSERRRVRPRGGHGEAVPDPGNDLPHLASPKGIACVVFPRCPDVHIRWKRKALGHHTDDKLGLSVYAERDSREVPDLLKMLSPEPLADDRHAWTTFVELLR